MTDAAMASGWADGATSIGRPDRNPHWGNLFRSELRRVGARRQVRIGVPSLLLLLITGFALTGLAVDTGGNAPTFMDIAFEDGPSSGVQIFGPAGWFAIVTGFIAGSVNIGAELRSRTLELLFTWVPARRRLLSAKVAAQSVVFLVASFAVAMLFVAGVYGLTLLWGTAGEVPAESWGRLVVASGRFALIASLFGVLGFCATLIVNSSLVVTVLFVIWAGQVEPVVRYGEHGLVNWLPVHNAGAFIEGTGVSASYRSPLDTGVDHGLGFVSLVLAAYLLVALTTAGFVSDRRDFS